MSAVVLCVRSVRAATSTGDGDGDDIAPWCVDRPTPAPAAVARDGSACGT